MCLDYPPLFISAASTMTLIHACHSPGELAFSILSVLI